MNMEWSKAQQIGFTVNLAEAAKQHLQFLAVVDSTGCLYDGPALERAINRYVSFNCFCITVINLEKIFFLPSNNVLDLSFIVSNNVFLLGTSIVGFLFLQSIWNALSWRVH